MPYSRGVLDFFVFSLFMRFRPLAPCLGPGAVFVSAPALLPDLKAQRAHARNSAALFLLTMPHDSGGYWIKISLWEIIKSIEYRPCHTIHDLEYLGMVI